MNLAVHAVESSLEYAFHVVHVGEIAVDDLDTGVRAFLMESGEGSGHRAWGRRSCNEAERGTCLSESNCAGRTYSY